MVKAKSTAMGITYQKALTLIKKGANIPVYFIYGEEKFLHDELIEKIIKVTIAPAMQDFNLDRFYATEVEIEKVINIAKSYPMMAETRTTIVKDIDKFKPNALKKLAEYTAKPSQTSCLVLTMSQKAKTGKAYKIITDNSVSINCRQFYDNEVAPWVEKYLKTKKLEIELPAIHLLQSQAGNSLLNITSEIEKISANIHPRNRITQKDIQDIISISKTFNIFELCKAIGNKNLLQSLTILKKLLEQGENPTGMVIQITRHFVNLLKIKECINAGTTAPSELSRITKLANFFIADVRKQSNNFNIEQLKKSFNYLSDADLHLKTGYQKPYLVMELLLYKLIRG